MDFLAKSPDLNPMKNVQRIIVRYIYTKGKQFDSIPEFKADIFKMGNQVPISTYKNLAKFFTKQLLEVLRVNSFRGKTLLLLIFD